MTFLPRCMAPVVMALFLCVSLAAQAGQMPLTLPDAIARTLADNPELAGLGYQARILAGERQTAALRPGYTLDLDVENIAGSGDFKGVSALEMTLSLSSAIELGGRRDARLALLSAREKQLASVQRQQTLDVLARLTQQFIRVLASQQSLLLQQQAQALAEAALDSVRHQVSAGRLPDAELLRAQAQLTQARLDTQSAEQTLAQERLQLARFWNGSAPDFGELRADLFAIAALAPLSDLQAQLDRNPDLAVLADELAVQQANLRQAQTQGRPDLGWSAGVRRMQDTGGTALVVGLSLPLGSEGRNRGAIAAASAQQAEAEWRAQQARRQLAVQLQTQVSAHAQARDQAAQLREQIIPLLTQAADFANTAFQQGRYSPLERHLARRDLLDARHRLIEAAATAQQLTVDIERLLGVAPARITVADEKVLP